MIFLKKPPSSLSSFSSTSNAGKSEAKLVSPKNIARLAVLIAGAGLVFCSPMKTPVLAKTGQAADVNPEPVIDPGSMEALTKMGTYLRTLKSFQVDTEVTNDDVLDDGEIVTDSRKDTLLAVRPNRLRVELPSSVRS
jgi:Predicted periplasmic protein (DUF2092)